MLCFTIVWDTPGKEKVAKWSSAPASILEGFNEIYVVYGPPKPYKTREKRQSCQIDPCLPPYRTPFACTQTFRETCSILFVVVFVADYLGCLGPRLRKREGHEHRKGGGSNTFLESKWVLRSSLGTSYKAFFPVKPS